MASALIYPVQTISGNQPRIRRIIEEAAATFLIGVPLMVASGDGGLKIWDGTTVAFGIAGISLEAGANLATVGVPKTLTFGSVPNEASAVNIPRGAPLNDGRTGIAVACDDTVFAGQVGPAQTALATDVGVQYGMTVDSDGHWYVDKTKSTVGTNTVVTVTKLDPNDQSATPRGVYFIFANGAQQLRG